jgi:hypothetical protein
MRARRSQGPIQAGSESALPAMLLEAILAAGRCLRSPRKPMCDTNERMSSAPLIETCQYQSPECAVPMTRFQVRAIRATIPKRSRA